MGREPFASTWEDLIRIANIHLAINKYSTCVPACLKFGELPSVLSARPNEEKIIFFS